MGSELRDAAGPWVGENGFREFEYAGGWGWRVAIDAASAGAMTMRMDNVVPHEYGTAEAPAGPYAAMSMTLRPA